MEYCVAMNKLKVKYLQVYKNKKLEKNMYIDWTAK